MTKTLKAAIYVRISRDQAGEGLGVARQEKACRERAESLGWTVVDIYSDNDQSAYSGKRREGYRRMLADIESGKVTGVIAWHTDRLHRKFDELGEYAAVCIAHNVPTQTVQAGQLDLATPSGLMVARILGSTAAFESDHKSARLTAKHAELREAGKMVGARSFGWHAEHKDWRIDPQTGEVKEVRKTTGALDPVEADFLRHAAKAVLSGRSPFKIAQWWNGLGLRTTKGGPWTHSNLRLTLLNPKIAGLRAHKGKVVRDADGDPVRGQWEPILEVEEWVKLVAVISRKRKTREGSTKHLLGGIVRCECGGVMWGAHVRKPTHGASATFNYSCRDCRTAISHNRLHPVVMRAMAASVLFGHDEHAGLSEEGSAALHGRLTALRRADERLLELVDADVFSVSEIAAKRADLTRQIAEIEQEQNTQVVQDADESFLTEVRLGLWSGGKVSFEAAAEAKATILKGLENLDFERQRALIRGSLEVTVRKVGKGQSKTERVKIKHLVTTSLNDDIPNEEALAV